ncbi:MAG: bis(5'-nucleosyl)-tetraphosphatase (symmetrical) YqeK [Peptostreptococcus sp.]|uniref:bis(5'-nucleosyl)-tetraphosphatase (symmetrical) YqeK n=1 Tax=Peptostreptococcus sp. TaxID=1262 RepID=UPI002FCA7C89
MNKSEMIEKLSDYLPEKRIRHSLNVAKAAVKLCEFCECDKEKAEIAGILHDTAKYIKFAKVGDYCEKYGIELDELEKNSTALSHSVVGAYIAKYEFGIEDEEILNAIRYHTTGRPAMKPLEKVIYLADLIEDGRDYPGVDELRELAYSGKIDEVIVKSIDNTIINILNRRLPLHVRTVEARNYYIRKLKSVKKG